MSDRMQKIILGIVAVLAAVLMVGVYTETEKCEAMGGKRLRPALFGGFKCYDAASLKELPAPRP